MGAFLENSLFFFVDDAEPILPIFRSSPEYGDPGRIVEVTDVGCDTETIYPMHFHRRRGGAESYASTRRNVKWRNERPNRFSRTVATILNNNKDRSGNYNGDKTRRRIEDRIYDDDIYIADSDYDSCTENFYDDFELPKDDSVTEYKDDYYTRFVDARNMIGHSNPKKLSRDTRYNYTKDPESPFAQSGRAYRRENTYPRRRFAESDERNFREDVDIRSGRSLSNERKKRTKILSRTDDDDAEFGKARGVTKRGERDDFPNAIDSKDNFWDSVSLENEVSCEELLKNHDDLQPKTSYNYIDSERDEESGETRREDLSSKISTGSAKFHASKSDGVKKKILQSNTVSANSPRIKSARTSVEERRASNMNSAGKNSINVRPRSAMERKKICINSSSERRTETMNARTNVDDRRVNKLSNETHQPARTFKRNADSNSNERIYATNEADDTNPRSRNPRNNPSKIDRTVAISRSAGEEKNVEKTTLTSISPCTGVERKKRKFFSRLPIRTWKRLRTKEPIPLRLKTDVTNEDDNLKLQAVDIATTNSNDHLEKIKNDEVREEIRTIDATADRSDIKRNNRFEVRLLSSSKLKTTSSTVKNIKGLKNLSTLKGTSKKRRE